MTFHAAGCGDDDPDCEVITLRGKVEELEGKPNGTGVVTKTTGIVINGVIARLEDIRQGERIRGGVRVDKKGSKKERTALKIYIDRARPVSPPGS